jgi:NitT/TauT family transport system permease protein
MGRFRPVERFFLPLVSVLSPIPSLAWVPLFIIWFGLGNAAAIGLVVYAAIFPFVLNTWTGVRSVNRLWLRAAESMGADPRALFLKVVLPGALPFIIAGFRQAFARSWIAVVGGEMIAATTQGLGFVIFDAKEYLNTDVMLGSLLVIGLLGLAFERFVFQAIERHSVGRWGMVRTVRS